MVRRPAALILAVAVLLAATPSQASDLRRGSIIPRGSSIVPRVGPIVPHGPNIVPNPPREHLPRHGVAPHKGDKHGGDHRRRLGDHRPGFVFVSPPIFYAAPRQCVTEGYWAYQWIPTSYAQNIWVPGGWAADGTWVESRWEQRAYASGYYQPYWVPGQTYAC
jgi:hypothetical protein